METGVAEGESPGMASVPMLVLVRGAPLYPAVLESIPDPPECLWVRGRLDLLRELGAGLAVAVVGSRDASAYGISVAGRFGAGLASLGVTVVSGLARGIDAAAHRAALIAGGPTAAVLATGIDRVYPAEHRDLAERIAAEGLLLTEFPPGTPPLRHHFVLRNRLISGLSLAVVVVEAAERSGALMTARLAGEQGREVFAVPGPAGAGRSAGPHRLLREGAGLVESVKDLVQALPPLALLARPVSPGRMAPRGEPGEGKAALPEPSSRAVEILRALEELPRSLDELVEILGRPVWEISREISCLEVHGRVSRGPAGRFMRGGF